MIVYFQFFVWKIKISEDRIFSFIWKYIFSQNRILFQDCMQHTVCGIRVVGKGSWKKREVGKVRWSWKEPSEVRKNRAELERTERSWKASLQLENFLAVGKFRCSWKVLAEVGKFIISSKLGLGNLQIRVRVTYKLGLGLTLIYKLP